MNPFWKDVLDKGAILGIVMAISKAFENHMTSGGVGYMGITMVSLEALLSIVIYISLLVIFARKFRKKMMDGMTSPKYFNFSTGWSWTVMVALLAGIIVGLSVYIDTVGIIGYDNYINGIIETVRTIISDAKIPSSMMQPVTVYIDELRKAECPTLLNTVFSTSWVYMLAGMIIGLIIGGALQHSPKFNDEEDDE